MRTWRDAESFGWTMVSSSRRRRHPEAVVAEACLEAAGACTAACGGGAIAPRGELGSWTARQQHRQRRSWKHGPWRVTATSPSADAYHIYGADARTCRVMRLRGRELAQRAPLVLAFALRRRRHRAPVASKIPGQAHPGRPRHSGFETAGESARDGMRKHKNLWCSTWPFAATTPPQGRRHRCSSGRASFRWSFPTQASCWARRWPSRPSVAYYVGSQHARWSPPMAGRPAAADASGRRRIAPGHRTGEVPVRLPGHVGVRRCTANRRLGVEVPGA